MPAAKGTTSQTLRQTPHTRKTKDLTAIETSRCQPWYVLGFRVSPQAVYIFFTRTASIASVSCVQIWRRRPGLGSVGSAQTSLERLFVKRWQDIRQNREGRHQPRTGKRGEGSGAGVEPLRAVVSDQAATDQAAKVGLRWRRIGLRRIRHAVRLLCAKQLVLQVCNAAIGLQWIELQTNCEGSEWHRFNRDAGAVGSVRASSHLGGPGAAKPEIYGIKAQRGWREASGLSGMDAARRRTLVWDLRVATPDFGRARGARPRRG